jgi:hypothetical protein
MYKMTQPLPAGDHSTSAAADDDRPKIRRQVHLPTVYGKAGDG